MGKLSEQIEEKIVRSILIGKYAVGATLPLEREFSEQLNVGRPTLREALQRLERDGWITVKKGSPTKINDYMKDGNLNIIRQIAKHPDIVPSDVVVHLLELRVVLVPVFIKEAIEKNPARVVSILVEAEQVSDDPMLFAEQDWNILKALSRLSENPLYNLMLNSFDEVFLTLGKDYFDRVETRDVSKKYYKNLLECAMGKDGDSGFQLALQMMEQSVVFWKQLQAGGNR